VAVVALVEVVVRVDSVLLLALLVVVVQRNQQLRLRQVLHTQLLLALAVLAAQAIEEMRGQILLLGL
jgi:hypothetical protein